MQCRVVLSVLVCSLLLKCFHNKHNCATERTPRTPAGGFFDSAPLPSFYVVHRMDRRGGHVIYVVRRQRTCFPFFKLPFSLLRQGNQSASHKLGCARLKKSGFFLFFFFNLFIKVLFSSSSQRQPARSPPFYFLIFSFPVKGC